ncbi:MAG: translation initiation factor IF-2 [Verrucomicrobia bacterium]|nr:translation initiation factor IF-2 [Verrucomicrobiota bacterium]
MQLGKLKQTKEAAAAEKKAPAPKKPVKENVEEPTTIAAPELAAPLPPAQPETPVVEIEKVLPPPPAAKEEVVEEAPPPPPKKQVVVDDFRRPKIIRKTAPPPPIKKLPVSRQDAKPQEKKGPPPKVAPKADTPAATTQKPGEEKEGRKPGSFKDYHDVRSQRKPSQKSSFDARDRMGLRDSDDERWRKKRLKKMGADSRDELTVRPKTLSIRLPISVKDLAVEMKVKSSQLISKLFMQGVALTINDFLDDETTVQLLGHEFGCEISIDTTEEKRIKITDKTIKEEISATDASELKLRSPVITFMGHVDHGKTSLIDAIRKSDLAAAEAGAITQHIGAFKCHSAVGDITILDTPGHEAFSSMRERGAVVTDLVVLVIAGDEGMRDQTIEAMNKAKEAGVPILVAINKSDKPNFDPNTVYRQLSEHELLPEAWGGTTITVNCSATTGAGVKELLEMLALQAEVLELKANPHGRARGSVIESAMHKGLGAVATLLVQNGTLRVGDPLVFDLSYAKVKTMHDEHGKELKEAGPSTPVKITGLSELPEAGSDFIAVESEKEARSIALARQEEHKGKLAQKGKRGLEGFLESKAAAQEKKVLNVIIRADVQGSVEALKQSLQKIKSDKAELNIVSFEVGQISESDVALAAASNAVILGFHTKVESHAEGLIRTKKVVVKLHNIIYHAVDEVKELMRQKLDKIAQENDMGMAEVRAIFKSSQLGKIAGCMVTDGIIKRSHHMRVIRGKAPIWKGTISSLKKVKEDVREVTKGMECGILLNGFNDFQEGDLLQSYEITYLEQEL